MLAALLSGATTAAAQATPRPAHIVTTSADALPFPWALGPAGAARLLAADVAAQAIDTAASSPAADQIASDALLEATVIVANGWNTLSGYAARPGQFEAQRQSLPDPSGGAALRAGFGVRPRTSSPTVHRHTGLTYASTEQRGAVVVADGVCMFADLVDGLGLVAIVQHNDGYMTVYANLAQLTVTAGTPVDEGTLLGHTGAGSPLGDDGLYFELRFNGVPIDPIPWLRQTPPTELPAGTSR